MPSKKQNVLENSGLITLSKDFLTNAINVLSSVEQDSSPECLILFFKIEDNKLFLVRRNRFSEIIINCDSAEVQCHNVIVPVLFEDMSKISKTLDDSIDIKITEKGMTIIGEDYKYVIQSFNFTFPMLSKIDDITSDLAAFSLKNSTVKELYSSLVVAPLKRNPSCLDSIYFHEGSAYCVDHSIMSSFKLEKNISLDKPIPLFLFNVSQKLNDECSVSFYPVDKNIAVSFNIGDLDHVICICSYLNGDYPIEKVEEIFSFSNVSPIRIENEALFAALKKVKSISGKQLPIINCSIEKDKMHIELVYSEKSIETNINISPEIPGPLVFKVMIDGLFNAIKKMSQDLSVNITDRFLIVFDSKIKHILPLSH